MVRVEYSTLCVLIGVLVYICVCVCVCVFYRRSIREKTIPSNSLPVGSPKSAAWRDKSGFLMCVFLVNSNISKGSFCVNEYFRDSPFCNLEGALI